MVKSPIIFALALLLPSDVKSFFYVSERRYVSPNMNDSHRYSKHYVDGKRIFVAPTKSATRKIMQIRMVSDPDPSILICNQNENIQRLAFISAFALLAAGTSVCVNVWHGPAIDWIGVEFYETIRSRIFPILFGLIFGIVGVLHFVFDSNFVRIVPPKGTWGGMWQAPAPGMDILGCTYEEYHCYWTGIAESIGGLWLFAAATELVPVSTDVPALLLLLLTIGVTPANLYMFTHDAHPGGAIPKLDYPFGHIARFVVQCGLLSNFWIMFRG